MSDQTNDILQKAIEASLAKEILSQISTEEKHRILAEAVSKVLAGWEFRRQLENAVKKVAGEAIEEIIKEPTFQDEIKDAASTALGELLEAVIPALLSTLMVGFRSGSERYNQSEFFSAVQAILNTKANQEELGDDG